MSNLTQNKLKELLNYDANTGIFTWKSFMNGRVKKGSIAGEVMKKGYIRIAILKERHMAHRLAFLYMLGRWPYNEVDHINRNKSDNRWINLRDATSSENTKNKSIYSSNKSGIPGVEIISDKQWRSSIRIDRKLIHLGLYTDRFEAICARKAAEAKYGFHENHGKSCNKNNGFIPGTLSII